MKTHTTRPMTKSALAVARQAMAVARDELPPLRLRVIVYNLMLLAA